MRTKSTIYESYSKSLEIEEQAHHSDEIEENEINKMKNMHEEVCRVELKRKRTKGQEGKLR